MVLAQRATLSDKTYRHIDWILGVGLVAFSVGARVSVLGVIFSVSAALGWHSAPFISKPGPMILLFAFWDYNLFWVEAFSKQSTWW